MNIDESIIEFKKMIERDKDTLRYWKSDTFGHYDEPIKKLEKDVLISETLLTAYEKEKEKNKELKKENKNLNLVRLQYLVSSFPDTTETFKKYKKELDELLKEE